MPRPGAGTSSLAIGLDVGGTKIAGGAVDPESGAVVARRVVPTAPARGGEAVLADALQLAESLAAEAARRGATVIGVGIGVAELVDLQGRVQSAHLIDWRGIAVAERFARIAPAVVESDVRAAALGEGRFGAGRDSRLFAYVGVGTGISCCLVQDGVPFAGARGNALILASGRVTVPCPRCGNHVEHVLEEYASGPALVARYRQRTGRPLARAEEVVAAAAAGDPAAADIVGSAGASLGSSLGWLVNVWDPELIVVGGGLGLAGGRYWESMVVSTRAHIWSETARDLPIVPASLGPDAGLIGAAATAARPARRAAPAPAIAPPVGAAFGRR